MDNKPSFRTKKVELSIKRLVSEYLVTQKDYLLKFPTVRFEITEVRVSKDLRFAKIYLIHNISDEDFKKFNKLYQDTFNVELCETCYYNLDMYNKTGLWFYNIK